MPRLASLSREVGYLVLLHTRSFQSLTSHDVQIRRDIFIGHEVSMIFCTASDHFPAEARIFIYLEHVHAGVRHFARKCLLDRKCPAVDGLMWQPAIRSMLRFVMPAARRFAISSSTVVRLCNRPTEAAS
jgi:hypothetical protein